MQWEVRSALINLSAYHSILTISLSLICHVIMQVTTPGGTFRATNECKSKKQAKMEAAKAALEGLGLIAKT